LNRPKELHEELLKKCKKGDESAQFRLYKMYSKTLYNLILRMLGNKMDAQDILQETFVSAFDKIHQLGSSFALASWLRRIALNKALAHLRLKKIEYSDLEELEDFDEELVYDEISMEDIHKEISDLPQGCRIVFSLFLLEDYSHKEIAMQLGISESTSKSQYSRAKQLLKSKLMKHYERG
jgi:RNA polymerase sigma-70 factor (ECF subfamily)